MLTTKLLAFGITHLTDARYFAAWDADFLCFPIGMDGISMDYFIAIREWVEGPVCVAELGADAGAMLSPEELADLGVTHLLQTYGSPTAAYRQQGIALLTRLPVAGYQSIEDLSEQLSEVADVVVLDFTEGGITYQDLCEGHPFSLDQLTEAIGDRKVFLRIELKGEEAQEIATNFHGLALRGSSEEKVGYKSFDDIDALLESLEA